MSLTLLDPPVPTIENATRRQLLAGVAVASLAAGCGVGGTSPQVTDAGEGFPRTLPHAFGETTIPAPPRRVVTVGTTEQDPVLALGVRPVGVTTWFGDSPIRSWSRAALGDERPAVLPAQTSLEAIAALAPDLIVGTQSGMDADAYRRLSAIAPVLARAPGSRPFTMPWPDQTRSIGDALGRRGQADRLVADVEACIADARQRLARYAGARAVMVNGGPARGQVNVYKRNGKMGRLLTGLGFEVPADLDTAGSAFGADQAVLGLERLDLLDRDLVIWNLGTFGDADEIRALPTYRRLGVVRDGRDVFVVDDELYSAIAFGTAPSLPFAVDGLVPKLLAALDGDPATTVPG